MDEIERQPARAGEQVLEPLHERGERRHAEDAGRDLDGGCHGEDGTSFAKAEQENPRRAHRRAHRGRITLDGREIVGTVLVGVFARLTAAETAAVGAEGERLLELTGAGAAVRELQIRRAGKPRT
jgi:hypothetical protein